MKKYIVIEGIHGSGKSSVAKLLAKKLIKKGISAEYYHFPDENDDLGKVIRKTVSDKDLVYQREITGLLYAAFANIFHTKTKKTDKIYILDRHSVTTGLVFQRQMSWSTRLEIYNPGIQSLLEDGQIFYLKIDKEIAKERSKKRNEELLKSKGEVWKDKAKDVFVEKKFDELTSLYEQNLIPQIGKLGLSCEVINNNSTIENTVNNILDKLLY